MDREARAATIALKRLDAETKCSRVLLAVDAAALVYAEKKGFSQKPHICEFGRALFVVRRLGNKLRLWLVYY